MKKGEVWCKIGFINMDYIMNNFIRPGLGRASEVWGHAGFQKYFRNTGWMFGGRVFALLASLLVSVYIARNLGPEQYGTLNFIISFVSIVGFTLFVIDSILIKKLNEDTENTDSILGTALLIKLINAFFTIIVATTIAFIFANTQTTIFLVLAYSTFTIFQSFNVVDSYFQSKAKNKYVAITSIFTSLFSSLIKIFIVYQGFSIFFLLISYVIDHVLSSIGFLYIYKKKVGNFFKWKIKKELLYYFIKKSWPFTLSAVAASIYIRIDQLFIKVLLGSEQLGLYVVAVRFSEVWFFISSIVCASLLPAIFNSQKTSPSIFLERSKKLYSLLFYTSILICILIFITAPLIINTLYGAEYFGSIFLLRIYIWSIVGVFVNTALQQFLLVENKFKTILILNVLGMVISIILNYVFIPIWGSVGSAIANIFAYSLPVLILLMQKGLKDQRKAFLLAIFKPFSK